MSNFSERLKELMEEREISANQLSKEIHVSGRTVCRWLNEEFDLFLPHAILLADYFECSLDYLVGRVDHFETVKARPLPPFYESLRKAMKKCNLTRYRISKESQIKDVYFTKWKNGTVSRISTVCELADYMKVSLDYLTGRTDY